MKHPIRSPIVRKHTFTRLTARLAVMVLFAALLSAAPFHTALAQSAPDLGTASSFAVLGGPAVTLTDSIVTGDVGSPFAVTLTTSTVAGTVYPAADPIVIAAYNDAFVTSTENLSAYDELAAEPCGTYLTGDLAVASTEASPLPPGVYCVEGFSATTGGTLWLGGSSSDTWIFKIGTSDTTAYLEATGLTVKMTSGDTCSNNVYWWVADYATMTDSVFIGSILAGAAITVTRGSLDGQALAKAAVTLNNTDVSICGSIVPPPPSCKDWSDYWNNYWNNYWKKHCKDYCKDCCKHHDKDKDQCKDQCKDQWKDYWKEYWKDHGKYHCKDHEKEYCKDHYCTDHDKGRCKGNDKDHRDQR